jgi:hypothetical protein
LPVTINWKVLARQADSYQNTDLDRIKICVYALAGDAV